MSNTYCGKDCDACLYRRELPCFGCSITGHLACPIARCCRNSRRENCCSCPTFSRCDSLRNAQNQPKDILLRREEAHQLSLQQRTQAAALGKPLWILFWLSAAGGIASALSGDLGIEGISALQGYGAWISPWLQVITGILLLSMGADFPRYRTAGWLVLGTGLVGFLPGTAAGILSLCLVPVGSYYLCSAHSSLMSGYSKPLSRQWHMLWKVQLLAWADRIVRWLIQWAAARIVLIPGLIHTVYLVLVALGYLILLAPLWETWRSSSPKLRAFVNILGKLPFKLVYLDLLMLLVVFGLLYFLTLFVPVLIPVLNCALLLRTARTLSESATPIQKEVKSHD